MCKEGDGGRGGTGGAGGRGGNGSAVRIIWANANPSACWDAERALPWGTTVKHHAGQGGSGGAGGPGGEGRKTGSKGQPGGAGPAGNAGSHRIERIHAPADLGICGPSHPRAFTPVARRAGAEDIAPLRSGR